MSETSTLHPINQEIIDHVPNMDELRAADNDNPFGVIPAPEQQQLSKDSLQDIDYDHIPGIRVGHINNSRLSLRPDQAPGIGKGATNTRLGVEQELKAVVRLGGQGGVNLGLTEVTHDNKKAYMVTELTDSPDERPKVIGFFGEGKPLEVGRNSQQSLKDNKFISRKHATFELNHEGSLVFTDTSTNGTEVVTYSEALAAEDMSNTKRLALGALARFAPKRGTANSSATDLFKTKVVDDFQAWAPKTAEVKEAFLEFTSPTPKPKEAANWNYTSTPEEVARMRRGLKDVFDRLYEEPGGLDYQGERYGGRPVIKRDSPIEGGVYIVPKVQEAIVVSETVKRGDDGPAERIKAYDDIFSAFAKELSSTTMDSTGKPSALGITSAAYNTVRAAMKYDLAYAKKHEQQYADRKVNLAEFIAEGKGVCRHQALAAGYLIERAVKQGIIDGDVSVDRNSIPGKGGHAWARYTSSKGEVYIIDVAQEFVGSLNKADEEINTWNYRRPNE